MASIVKTPLFSFVNVLPRDPEILACYWLHIKTQHLLYQTLTHTLRNIILFPEQENFQ